MDTELQTFLSSYLVANKLVGYLHINRFLTLKTADQELALICEFAGQMRLLTKSVTLNEDLLTYHFKYGVDRVVEALQNGFIASYINISDYPIC
jgi:hypothetical protein